MRDDNGGIVRAILVMRDVTERRQTELELAPAVNQLYQQIYQEVTGGA